MTGIRLIQDSDGNVDLELSGGQMAVGDVTGQNQYLLLYSHKGDWKEHPALGAGIADIANDHDLHHWERLIAKNLEADGLTIETLKLTTDKLTLKARYRQ